MTGRESSQYLSSLLLAAPYAGAEVEITVDGSIVSSPYVDLTLEVMDRFGVGVRREGYSRFNGPGGTGLPSRRLPGGRGCLQRFLFLGGCRGNRGHHGYGKRIPGKLPAGRYVLSGSPGKNGSPVRKEARRAVVTGRTLAGIEADMSAMPDMVPTLAALALFAKGKTAIRNVAHLRYKESDRLQAVSEEWSRLGARIEELPDGLIIEGSAPLNGALCDPHNDHRLAMSLAVIGLRVPGIKIQNETCVRKSVPNFWALWDCL